MFPKTSAKAISSTKEIVGVLYFLPHNICCSIFEENKTTKAKKNNFDQIGQWKRMSFDLSVSRSLMKRFFKIGLFLCWNGKRRPRGGLTVRPGSCGTMWLRASPCDTVRVCVTPCGTV